MLVSRNTYFCVFILDPVTLPDSLMSYNSFLIVSLGFLYVSYHVTCKQWQFYFFFFQFWFLFFLLWLLWLELPKLCWIKAARGHPSLIPDFWGDAFSFSPLRMIFPMGLVYMAFIMLRWIAVMPTFWRMFIIKECWILSEAFSASIEIILWLLFFNLLTWSITLICRYWKILAFLG